MNRRAKSRSTVREQIIAEYHDLLLNDAMLPPDVLQRFHDDMRANRLVYGDRPIGVSLRPHFLDRDELEGFARNAELIASALEKVAAAVLRTPRLMADLGMTEREQQLALVDPGFQGTGITTRIDGFRVDCGIKFVEFNGENPSSLSDQEGLNRLLSDRPTMSALAERYRFQQFFPMRKLLETLLVTYQEWGGTGRPNIAIVDWKNLPTATEFVLLQEYFSSQGVRTVICSPDELEYTEGRLRCGDFEIDLVYKRVLIHELLARCEETHPLIRAYCEHHVCLVNPFRCKIIHKKASFEFLTDPKRQAWFSPREKKAIAQSIPWTRRLRHRRTTRHGHNFDLVSFVRANRERLVLKPNDDYGGHGVFIGSHVAPGEWEDAVEQALSADYVVQDAIDLPMEEFPVFNAREWKLQPMFVDTNPFLFRGKFGGAMVRLSGSPVVNVTSGGGETGFFVVEARS